MKNSMFNVCASYNDKFILYNSLSQKLFYASDDVFLRLGRAGEAADGIYGREVEQKLISYGFLVEDDADELKIRDMVFGEKIMNGSLGFTVFTTYKCNFRCKYCYERFENLSISETVEQAVLLYIQKYLHKYSALHIGWFGGEPLIELQAIERMSKKIIHVCRQIRRPYSASMTTNGYLLAQDVFERLLKCHINSFQITIDGDESLHDKYRVTTGDAGTFEKIFSNLKAIRDNVKTQNFNITIRTNCTQETLEHLEVYLSLMSREFSNDSRFTFVFKDVQDLGGTNVGQLKDKLDFAHEELYRKLLCSKYPMNYDGYLWLLNSDICYAGKKNEYAVSPKGEIMKCTVQLYDASNIIGELTPKGDMMIDKNKEAKWLLRGRKELCHFCRLSPQCYGGSCPAAGRSELRERISCMYNDCDAEYYLKLIAVSCGRVGKGIERIQ